MKVLGNFKITAVVAMVAVSAAIFTGCGNKKGAEDDGEKETLYAVSAVKLKAENLDNYLEFGGDVASVNEVNVLPDMAGKIARIMVSVGQNVEKNQVLAYVDASRPGYDFSESPVKAPIAGRITSISPTIGTQVSQGTPVAKISNTDDLEIKVNVAERFVSRIKFGQKAELTFDAYPGETFDAQVSEVSPVLDTSTRTMQIKIRITQRDNKIKVGMYARVKLITDSVENAIVIPSSAVLTRDGKPYVFVMGSEKTAYSEATVKLQSVTVGLTVDDKTEIKAGLSPDDVVIVKGQSSLNDNDKVNIITTK